MGSPQRSFCLAISDSRMGTLMTAVTNTVPSVRHQRGAGRKGICHSITRSVSAGFAPVGEGSLTVLRGPPQRCPEASFQPLAEWSQTACVTSSVDEIAGTEPGIVVPPQSSGASCRSRTGSVFPRRGVAPFRCREAARRGQGNAVQVATTFTEQVS